ncbi:MerR family transcriptional regulator [Clostridiaceae bacterium M8S5]|nr:MerR family transcriptional regulator [Clostridiaceae bacterium M8S5]
MKIKIGEMSKLFNISIHTLRYYDEIGLLKPSTVDKKTGYRYYDEYCLYRLTKIKALKSIGVPLKKIQHLLQGTIEEVEDSFKLIREEVNKKINRLNQVASYLDEQLMEMKQSREGTCYIKPQIIEIPRREGHIIDVNDNTSLLEIIRTISEFEKKNDTNADIFYIPTRLMQINEKGVRSLRNYLAVKRNGLYYSYNDVYILDEGMYGVIDHIGYDKPIESSYKKLLEYIKDKGMKIKDTAIEVLVINSCVTDNAEKRRTQIQILLK